MLHPDTLIRRIDSQVGYGIVATQRIARGTVTWVQDPLDQIMEDQLELPARNFQPVLERYSYRRRDGRRLLCWDLTKYMNHSCRANCLLAAENFEIAVRDIERGEQLTNDYGVFAIEAPMRCRCGERGCRDTIEPQPSPALERIWTDLLRQALQQLPLVAQPLAPWATDWAAVLAHADAGRQ